MPICFLSSRFALGTLLVACLCGMLADASPAQGADSGKKAAAKSGTDKKKSGKNKSGKNKSSKPKGDAKGKASAPSSLPPLKTADDKLRLLDKIHASFPAKQVNTGFTVEELDRSLKAYIGLPTDRFADRVDDEIYVRRVHLDLAGRLPKPEELTAFVTDMSPDKRERLVDRLLESPEFSRHWARYWREVLLHKATANRRRINPKALEDWLAAQFEKKVGWDRIVCELIAWGRTRIASILWSSIAWAPCFATRTSIFGGCFAPSPPRRPISARVVRWTIEKNSSPRFAPAACGPSRW